MIYLVLSLVTTLIIAAEIGVESWLTRSRSEETRIQQRARIRVFSGVGGSLASAILLTFFAFLSGESPLSFDSLDFATVYFVVAATIGGILFVFLIDLKPKADPPPLPLPSLLIAFLGIIGGGIALFVALLAWICVPLAIDGIVSETRTRSPARYTHPLALPTATHLCEILQLGSEDERCQGEEVFFLAFLPDMQNHYGKGTPRERVNAEIGSYLVVCDEWVSTESDGVFQTCYYDFGQDGTYALAVSYRQGYPNTHDMSVVPTEDSGGYVANVSIPFINPSDGDLRQPLDR